MPDIEKGFRWWIRHVVVPLIGGGGLIAILVAFIMRPTSQPPIIIRGPLYNEVPGSGAASAEPTAKVRSEIRSPIPFVTHSTSPESSPAPRHQEAPAAESREPNVSPTSPNNISVAQNGFVFERPSCIAKGGRIVCDLVITNVDSDRRNLTLYWQYGFRDDLRTYLSDEKGHQVFATAVKLGALDAGNTGTRPWSGLEHFVTQELEPDVPIAASIAFDANADPNTLVTIVLVCQEATVELHKVIFKKVRLN
jgi:hypothetical protein